MAEVEGYNMPDELYYHAEHSWARVEADGTVTVGMNDMFQKTSGDIVYVDMPMEGDEVSQDEVIGKIQSSKWIGKLAAPISGEIVGLNEAVESDSGLINKDPYGEGWVLKIKPSSLDDELKNLMQGDAMVQWLKGEIEKAKKAAEGAKE